MCKPKPSVTNFVFTYNLLGIINVDSSGKQYDHIITI